MCGFFSKAEIEQFNQIIVKLYSNHNKEYALEEFLRNLKQFMYFEKGDIYVFEKVEGHINIKNYISIGYGAERELYINQYCDSDDVLPLISVKHAMIFRSSDIFLDEERKISDYYIKHLNPAKMHYSIEGNIYFEENGLIVGIGLHRSNENNDFSDKELEIIKLFRPHLSKVAQELCDINVNTTNLYDLPSVLTEDDKLGIYVWNEVLELINEEIGANEFLKENNDQLKSVIKALCNNVKNSRAVRMEASSVPDNVNSKIVISNQPYYVNVTYRKKDDTSGIYIAILYDYRGIIENIMSSVRDVYSLTNREYDVFKCLINGMSNKEIQEELFISMPTVKKHLTNIYQKLGVEGRHQLIHSIL